MNNSCLSAGRVAQDWESRSLRTTSLLKEAPNLPGFGASSGVACDLNRPGPGSSRDKVHLQRGWAPWPRRVARSRPRPLPPRAPAYGSRPQGVALQQCTGQIGRVGMRKAKAPQGCTNATGISARMHTKAAWTPDLVARSHATQSGRWTRCGLPDL